VRSLVAERPTADGRGVAAEEWRAREAAILSNDGSRDLFYLHA